jgi:hypothetical protein
MEKSQADHGNPSIHAGLCGSQLIYIEMLCRPNFAQTEEIACLIIT